MTMRTILAALPCILATVVAAQPRPANWPTYGGDAQRSGWEKADARISKETVKDLQLLWKMKLENQPKGPRPLLPPLILGNLISYRGFKELAFVASSSDIVYAIDADLGKTFWTKHLEYASLDPPVITPSSTCPGGLTAIPAMPPPAVGRGGPPAVAATPAPAPPPRGPFAAFGPASVYAISSDGRLHKLNTSTGDDQAQPVRVLPSNASVSSLNIADNVLYATTNHDCNGAPNAVWAIDLMPDPPKVTSLTLGNAAAGLGGPTIGSDGTIYVQTAEKLLALSPRDLQLKQSISLPSNSTSPLVFTYKEHDLIAAAGKDGRLYLFDSAGLETPLSQTSLAGPVWGNLSSWQDADGARWVLAPVWGPANAGSIAAFKVEEENGKPALTPAWVSRDIPAPQPPVVASGVVFALSSGKSGGHATLYALDAATGKELFSSRNLVTAPAVPAGITVSNGRVYFGTTDGTTYAFGMYMEH
jgi:outer membrane protein assembly factor BamB